jgi:hypothetical protein
MFPQLKDNQWKKDAPDRKASGVITYVNKIYFCVLFLIHLLTFLKSRFGFVIMGYCV